MCRDGTNHIRCREIFGTSLAAQQRGITITVYRQDPDGTVTIDAIDTVEGTYLLAPVRNLLARLPIRTGFPISTEAVAKGW